MNETGEEVRVAVRERYATAALAVSAGAASCCSTDDVNLGVGEGFGSTFYSVDDTSALPAAALLASLGCGNPSALATLAAGEVVLDLGSGGGIDVLLSARRVGPTGRVYGLDMTPEMVELARANQAAAGVTNAEFLLGTIEAIALPDQSVDVIISNCVINLAADKDAVLAEAFRVLKPGGRLAISDVVLQRALSADLAGLIVLWTGCVAGALVVEDYVAKLAAAGFEDASVTPTLVHDRDALERLTTGVTFPEGIDPSRVYDEYDGVVANAFIRARRPR